MTKTFETTKVRWITTEHIQSTDGKTEHIKCSLMLEFPTSRWNKKESSPVVEIYFYDYKAESGWWINPTQWHINPPHKRCEIKVNYLQRCPKITLYSSITKIPNRVSYEDFTLDFCKEQAIGIFKDRLQNLLNQLP